MIAYAETREEAILKMLTALRETVLLGIQNNKHFLKECLSHPSFRQGDLSTHFIDNHFPPSRLSQASHEGLNQVATAALLWGWHMRNSRRTLLKHVPSGWRNSFYAYQAQDYLLPFHGPDAALEMEYRVVTGYNQPHPRFLVRVKGQQESQVEATLFGAGEEGVDVEAGGVRRRFVVVPSPRRREELFIHNVTLGSFVLVERSRLCKGEEGEGGVEGGYVAPMPGKILQLLVQEGAAVQKGDALLVMESMKMESKVSAHKDGVVKLFVKEGQLIDAQTLLLSIENH